MLAISRNIHPEGWLKVAAPDERLDRTFTALADPTRHAILKRLSRGETRVTAIARPFEMSLNAVSKHIRVPKM